MLSFVDIIIGTCLVFLEVYVMWDVPGKQLLEAEWWLKILKLIQSRHQTRNDT